MSGNVMNGNRVTLYINIKYKNMAGTIKINDPPPRPSLTPGKSVKYNVKHTIMVHLRRNSSGPEM